MAAKTEALSQEQIARIAKDITKAIDDPKTPSSTYLGWMDELRAGMPRATQDLLRTTRIGIMVSKLKPSKDRAVAKAAKDLVEKWRNDVGAVGARGSPVPGAAKKENGVKTEGVDKAAAASGGKTVDPEKRNAVEDGVDYKVTGDATRDACAKLMYDGLAFLSEEPSSHILPIALAIEKAAYAHHGSDTGNAYKTSMRSLFQNLKNRQSPHLRNSLLSRPPTLIPERLVTMTPEELKSPERLKEDAELQKENMNKAMVPQESKSVSTAFTCGQCKNKKVSYTQAQTRSADEPMTTFCECLVCGKRWKFS